MPCLTPETVMTPTFSRSAAPGADVAEETPTAAATASTVRMSETRFFIGPPGKKEDFGRLMARDCRLSPDPCQRRSAFLEAGQARAATVPGASTPKRASASEPPWRGGSSHDARSRYA